MPVFTFNSASLENEVVENEQVCRAVASVESAGYCVDPVTMDEVLTRLDGLQFSSPMMEELTQIQVDNVVWAYAYKPALIGPLQQDVRSIFEGDEIPF